MERFDSCPLTVNPERPCLRADRSNLQAQLFDCLSMSVHEWMLVVFGQKTTFRSVLRNVRYAICTTPESERGNLVCTHPTAGEQHLGEKKDRSAHDATSETPAGKNPGLKG